MAIPVLGESSGATFMATPVVVVGVGVGETPAAALVALGAQAAEAEAASALQVINRLNEFFTELLVEVSENRIARTRASRATASGATA